MESNLDKLEFQVCYLDVSPFQERQAEILVSSMLGSRLGRQMRFLSYGTIDFDVTDHKHQYPKVTYIDSFKRGKTQAIVFDLLYNAQNNGMYDKLVIYNTTNAQNPYYGYVFYNSKEGKSSHRFLLDFATDELIKSLHRDFNLMLKSMIIDWYLKKSNAIKKLSKEPNTYVPNAVEYENMMKEYRKRMYIGYSDITVEEYWAGKQAFEEVSD